LVSDQHCVFPFGIDTFQLHFGWPVKAFYGCKTGRDIRAKPFVNIKYTWKLATGDHTWVGEGCIIENLAHVKLGDNVCLSQGCMLLTGNHNYRKTSFDLFVKPVIIEDGAWISAKAVVCPGVIVASYAVLRAGSVAVHNIGPYAVYQGNPGIKIRSRIIE
jgi:putative colanic acid biosynthesis acetyltransferase WcaF